jgi:hypothetical protein
MPNQFLTLKDISAFHGTDDVVGLVDNIVNVAPELDRVLGRPIKGISYRARILTALGSNAAFRKVGGGVQLSAPSFDRKRFNCLPFDCQMEVGEDLLIDAEEGETPAQIFEAHATAAVRQKALRIGKQFYLGSANDANGPMGLIDFLAIQRTQVDSRTGLKIDQAIDAGGNAAGKCEIVWFIKQGPQGVHWMFGNGRGIVMNPWLRQRTAGLDSTANNPTYRTAWVSNLFGYIGLSMANYHAIGAVINVDPTVTINAGVSTFAAPLNDQLVADLWAKFPITEKPDLAFCTQKAAASLQSTRAVTNFVQGGREWTKGAAPIADFPTSLPTAGSIPLVVTDSIVPSNQIVLN